MIYKTLTLRHAKFSTENTRRSAKIKCVGNQDQVQCPLCQFKAKCHDKMHLSPKPSVILWCLTPYIPNIPRIRDVSWHSERIFVHYCDIVIKMIVNLDHKCPIGVP